MSKRFLIASAMFIGVALAMVLVYINYVRPLVILAYYDQAPVWFENIVSNLYPRFVVEKKRFDLHFFLSKADQIIARSFLIGTLSVVACILFKANQNFKSKLNSFWNSPTSALNVDALRILYCMLLLIVFKDIYWDMMLLAKAKVFYKPLFLFKLLHLNFPSDQFILISTVAFYLFVLLLFLNVLPVLSSFVVIVLFIYFQGIMFGFEKIDHGFAPLTYAGMIVPFMLYSKKRTGNNSMVDGWSLKLIQVLIALCYLFSALEKIFISKLTWISPETFRGYLQLHPTSMSTVIASSDFLCFVLPTAALALQLGFIAILFKDKLKYIFIPAGVIFHISTYLLLEVGGFTNPWMLSYVFLFDWTKTVEQAKLFLKRS